MDAQIDDETATLIFDMLARLCRDFIQRYEDSTEFENPDSELLALIRRAGKAMVDARYTPPEEYVELKEYVSHHLVMRDELS